MIAMGIAQPPGSCKIYTPSDLAGAMARALGDMPTARWLEPSHGQGVFVEAIAELGVTTDRIIAVDLDKKRTPADSFATTVRGVDFLRWASRTDRRFDRIIGNPPFVSIGQLPLSLQKSAAAVRDVAGTSIGKGANLWYAFVLASLHLLRKGGSAAFILPSSAEFADYSANIRSVVARSFARLEIYRCLRPLFDEVQEGTVVAVAREYGGGPAIVSRRWFASRSGLIDGLSRSGRIGGHRCSVVVKRISTMTPLGSIARIGLGGVTGDARFFLMNESKRVSMGLPTKAMIPVVSKAKHLRSAALGDSDWARLRDSGERVWLFNPTDKMIEDRTIKKYLDLDKVEGGCNRQAYKISIRHPWYRTPLPSVPDAFLSGMSRLGPWLCLNESSRVNSTNTLYVVHFESRARSDWYMWALALLSSEARRQIHRLGRRYPDGLVKFEPGDLSRILLPRLRDGISNKEVYDEAIGAFLSGKPRVAMEIADAAIA